jgi:protease-4
MRSRSTLLFSATLLAAWAAAGSAAAEPLPRAERIDAIGRNAASDDTAEAIRLNPANLGFLPSWELRWNGVRCTDTQKVNCGHVLEAATPVIFGLATGLRVDYVIPPTSAGPLYGATPFAWLTWALAYKLSDALAFGASIQRSFSSNPVTDGMFGISAGATFRPDPHVAFAFVAQDFTRATVAPFPNGNPVLDRSFVLSGAFRPTGRRVLELGLELQYKEGSASTANDAWIPRATAAVDLPGVGRIRGDFAIQDLGNDVLRSYYGSAGLEIALGPATAGGGAMFGNSLGGEDVGEYGTLSIAGYKNPGIPDPSRAVSIRIETTPGTRGHVALLRKLWAIADASNISGLELVLRAEPASSYAHAEELADALRVIRSRGKKVLCSFEDNGAKSLYVCANADRIVVNPAGGVRYSGLRSQYMYLAGLLGKLGIKAEFVRIGAHKSAPEQFTNEHGSDVANADHEDLLRNIEAVFVKNLANGRHLKEEDVRAATAKGPFVAKEAIDAKFVDGTAFDDEVNRATREMLGRSVSVRKYDPDELAPKAFGPQNKVAILYVDGDMVDGRSQKIPILDMKLVGSYTIADTAKALRDDPTVKSVVLRIESPGGSSMAADVMWRELRLLAEKKPVVVSMGSVAASGGYYIATAGKEIYALPLTITGSIGIFYGKADASQLLTKIGVNVDTFRTTPRADAESIFRGFTEDEQRELQRKVGQFYDVFLDRVSTGRHMTKEQVDAVGQGRVWAGQQALDHHLVDKLGGLREALAEARALGGLPNDAPILEVPVIEKTLLEQVLDAGGIGAAGMPITLAGLPVQVKDIARALAPVVVYTGDVPMARLEWVSVEDEAGCKD